MENETGEKEKRIRKITKIYYSNPKVQEALLKFAKDREVVPRYFEGFGKRPDMLNYPSDVMGLVNKGATSFHASEELWDDVLRLNSDMGFEEMQGLRKGWDLLIDIDSPYLDLSRIAAKLVIKAMEFYGISSYGIKFSGSKGFHILVPGNAFPSEIYGSSTKKMFPEWARAITQFLFREIEPSFRKEAGKIMSFGKEKDEKERIFCKNCRRAASSGSIIKMKCPLCGMEIERRDAKLTKRKLRCLNEGCAGVLEIAEKKEYYYCEYCKQDSSKISLDSIRNPEMFEKRVGEDVTEHAKFDLVLVSPRHLFRMPYSLHEKTALASIVLKKEELDTFSPKDADPLRIKIRDFMPEIIEGQGRKLLAAALEWKKTQDLREEKESTAKYSQRGKESYENIDLSGAREDMFPQPILKLMKGLPEGRKRGLFILITFLRSLGFPLEKISEKVREWNKKNTPPLKEGYIKSQLDWHFRQKKKILPPNYENESFYKDLGLLDKKPDAKNPVVEVMRALRKVK